MFDNINDIDQNFISVTKFHPKKLLRSKPGVILTNKRWAGYVTLDWIGGKCLNGLLKTKLEINNKYIFLSITDQRTKPWLLSDTPGPLFTILGTYLYFCLYAGPRFMKDRKPFQLKNTLIWYNAIQVLASIVLVWEVGQLLIDPSTQFYGVLDIRILFSRD